MSKPFRALDNETYLHDRSGKNVFKSLVDAFRMRQADAFKFEGRKDPNNVYTGAKSSVTSCVSLLAVVIVSRLGGARRSCGNAKSLARLAAIRAVSRARW
jgi:hypothetical protein